METLGSPRTKVFSFADAMMNAAKSLYKDESWPSFFKASESHTIHQESCLIRSVKRVDCRDRELLPSWIMDYR